MASHMGPTKNQWLRIVAGWLVAPLCWMRPTQPRVTDDDQEDGIGHVITIATAIVAGTAAMISYLQETGTSKMAFVYYVYVPAFAIPIGALLLMLRMRVRGITGAMPHFNPSTAVAIRWAILSAIIIPAAVVYAGRNGAIPGQKPQRPTAYVIHTASEYAWKNPPFAHGIKASFTIDRDTFPEGYPARFVIRLSLSEPLRAAWDLTKADLTRLTPGQAPPIPEVSRNFPNPISTDDFVAPFFEKPVVESTYRVEVFLHSNKATAEELTAALTLIRDGIGIMAESPTGQ